MHHASCLCGQVTWEIEGPLDFMSHCHCSRCRKAHGTAFATHVSGPATGYRIRGKEHVTAWESSPGFVRRFCSTCGSVVPGDEWNGLMFLPVGSFTDDPGVRPVMHIFTKSKAPWYEIPGSLACFDAYPAGIDGVVMDDRTPPDPPGATRGSCNCGGVAFGVEGTPIGAWHCHCARCRKARSAAHASNMFVPTAGLRFTRGADLIASYKIPEALRFTQSFCRICGSKVPRSDPSRDRAVIPMGSLDDDPGFQPLAHIFVASKAPWFDITDGLPQHAEYPPEL